MNCRGQFSLIAALLVAVVLIGTVIITYSIIRNSPVQEQAQILSAIDETNLALKQILGFTIGYYGSVLQVTGNASYARALATNYLHSGLVNIANMHPERGASFNVSSLDLSTYWFTNNSYSAGNLAVTYSLNGLGMYGITYTTSCRLAVQIENTTSTEYVRLNVARDEGEPLINLGSQNFKFYRYVYANSTWKLITPNTELTAFANGTYLIETPPEIDPYSYVLQVEDPRGIIVVASSFSRYTITLEWNSTMYSLTSTTNVTLIDHESFEGSWPPSEWTETGRWNKESDRAYDGTYSADFDGHRRGRSGNLTTFDLNCYGANSIYVDFWYRDEGCDNNEFLLQYYDGAGWDTIADLGATAPENQWLHYQQEITDSQYFKSNFRIRWCANDIARHEHAYVDYVTVTVNKPEIPMTILVELLQNGTMRWLGQNLQMTTQAKPIPPIPVKAIHVNQTINNVDREVPFQIEDWASNYKIPLGLTNNASVFNSTTMLVFLVNPNVSKVTIWWNGSDATTQTSLAYTNKYFTYDTNQRTINNGFLKMRIDFSKQDNVKSFKVISTMGSSTATAVLMRINQDIAHYGDSEPMYSVLDGPVRAVLHHEVEWPSGGVSGCPNVYAHIVLTLPANATYYTYQLRLMFLDSQQPRNITDLCPIRLTYSGGQPQTENGTEVSTSTGLFYNFSASCWQHHWSQLTSASGTKGAGIMFTDETNKMLYYFDKIAGANTGTLSVSSTAIEFLPVSSRAQVTNFVDALDITWYGAVVTFDGTTPIYKQDNSGLWIIAEHPPVITVTTES